MILSDSAILSAIETGAIKIDPFNPEQLNPASLDLRLGNMVKYYENRVIDTRKDNPMITIPLSENGTKLHANTLYLAACMERIEIDDTLVSHVFAKSSIGRFGVDVIKGPAGLIDPGFGGSLVLEITCTNDTIVYPGDRICQIEFIKVFGKVLVPYGSKPGSKYMGQVGVQGSLNHLNFTK